MQIQVNSDKTIKVSVGLVGWVTDEANRLLDRFSAKVTRVEIHISDVNSQKSADGDKRCVIEARPAGAQPLSVTAHGNSVDAAVHTALGKARRALTTFFGKHGWTLAPDKAAAPVSKKSASVPKKAAAKSPGRAIAKKAVKKAAKKTVAKKAAKTAAETPATPNKKRIYQARRKAWPAR